MGEYNHTIDAKGRLIVPAKFREQLGEAFVITNGNDGCLNIYTEEDWETFLEKLQLLPTSNGDIRKIRRMLVAQAKAKNLTIITRDTIIPKYDMFNKRKI